MKKKAQKIEINLIDEYSEPLSPEQIKRIKSYWNDHAKI